MTEPVFVPVVVTPELIVNGVTADVSAFLGLASDDNHRIARHAATVVYGLLYGSLRGQMPMPIPQDLLAVLTAATVRYASGLLRIVRTGPQEPTEAFGLNLPDFAGWLFPEQVVIARYRQTTG